MTGRFSAGPLAGPEAGTRLFRLAAGLALALHAYLIFGRSGLWGGGDLVPHLRLIQSIQQQPGLHNTYAPFYHGLGALLAPLLGLDLYPKLFALAAAVLLIAGFRSFQRAAALPDTCAALFALTPYLLSLSWCTPRVEAAGYGLLLFGLGFLLRGRFVALALTLAASFAVHTASALLFGLAAGGLALARRDRRALVALALGTLLASPLIGWHLAAGCSFPEALLFAQGGYARSLRESVVPENWVWLVPLANPLALVAALAGAGATWRRDRSLALVCAALVVLYCNNVWLAPFDLRTLVTLLRGLSLLAIPIAIAAGLWTAARPRAQLALVLGSAAWAVFSTTSVVPHACFVRPIALDELAQVQVARCRFVWRAPRPAGPAPGAEVERSRGNYPSFAATRAPSSTMPASPSGISSKTLRASSSRR